MWLAKHSVVLGIQEMLSLSALFCNSMQFALSLTQKKSTVLLLRQTAFGKRLYFRICMHSVQTGLV